MSCAMGLIKSVSARSMQSSLLWSITDPYDSSSIGASEVKRRCPPCSILEDVCVLAERWNQCCETTGMTQSRCSSVSYYHAGKDDGAAAIVTTGIFSMTEDDMIYEGSRKWISVDAKVFWMDPYLFSVVHKQSSNGPFCHLCKWRH